MDNNRTYLIATSFGGGFFELAVTHTFGSDTSRENFTRLQLPLLRARVRWLRSVGFRGPKIGGGMDRLFAILAGKLVAEWSAEA